jgi:hypothetical protein
MLREGHLRDREARKGQVAAAELDSFPVGSPKEDVDFVRVEAQQRVMATCVRHFSGLCDAMLHVCTTAAYPSGGVTT